MTRETRTVTRRRAVYVVIALGAVLAGCTTDAGPESAAEAREREPARQWLFSLQSEGETTYENGRLVLPVGSVHAFTDRPYRDTRITSPDSFAALWNVGGADSFREDPPNAVLTYWDETGGTPTPRTAVCEITGDVTAEGGRLSMGLRVLEPRGATLPARMARASLFVDDVSSPSDCMPAPDDSENVEWFNQQVFQQGWQQGFSIQVQSGVSDPTIRLVSLTCPERTAPNLPPRSLDVRLTTGDGSRSVSCTWPGEGPAYLEFPAADLASLPWCGGDGCRFTVTASNARTGETYSSTDVTVPTGPFETVQPTLNPATMSICL